MTMRTVASVASSRIRDAFASATPSGRAAWRFHGGMTPTHTEQVRAPAGPAAVTLGHGPLVLDDVVAVARVDAPGVLAQDAGRRIRDSRRGVEGLARDPAPPHGVSPGF